MSDGELKILLVEDNPGDARLLELALQDIPGMDAQLEYARTLVEEKQKLSRQKYDVVLQDLGLPDSVGIETLHLVISEFKEVPIVVLTGLNDEYVALQAVQAGAQDYLIKGQIDGNILGKAIRYAIERHRNMEKIKLAEQEINHLYSSLLHDLKTASEIQTYLLPDDLIIHNNIQFSSYYNPSSRVGGDLYDIVKISDDRYYVYMGDISGHGVQAALLMTAVKSLLNVLIETEKNNLSPCEMATKLNQILTGHLFQTNYMTLMLGCIDLSKKEFQYINAGHPPIVQYNCLTHKAEIMTNTGSIPIGWDKNIRYESKDETILPLDDDCIYVMYTDGLFECENSEQKQLGLEGFIELLETRIQVDHCLLLPHKIKKEMITCSYNFGGDDFAILSFQTRLSTSRKCFYTVHQKPERYLSSVNQQIPPPMTDSTISLIGKVTEEEILRWTQNPTIAAGAELIVNEYLNNIFNHGLKKQPKSDVIFGIMMGKTIRLIFIDSGIPWTPRIIPGKEVQYDYDLNIQQLPESGWGMNIIQELASHFECHRYETYNETVIGLKENMHES